MAEVIGFLIEIVFRIFFEAVFERLFYGLKRIWFWITGQEDKTRVTLDRHRSAQDARRANIARIRQRRNRA